MSNENSGLDGIFRVIISTPADPFYAFIEVKANRLRIHEERLMLVDSKDSNVAIFAAGEWIGVLKGAENAAHE